MTGLTPAERRRLARAALPTRWLVGYGLSIFVLASALGSAIPALLLWSGELSLQSPAKLVELVLRLEAAWAALCLSGALWVGGIQRAVVRRSLARRRETEPVAAIGPCFADAGAWIRPAGAIVVTTTHLEFVAYRERHAALDLRWPLAEIDGIVPEADRLWFISRVGDMQGRLVITRGSERRSLSVVRRGALLAELSAAWDRARAARPGAGDATPRGG